jgi:predicted nucleic acid-binding protein
VTATSPARFYIDASALVKLLITERESAALEAALDPGDRFVSSDLVKVETIRALRRAGADVGRGSQGWLGRVDLVRITPGIRDRAATIGPPLLRSLDAIHLATMDEARAGIDGLISYDDRLIEPAHALGIRVLSPR